MLFQHSRYGALDDQCSYRDLLKRRWWSLMSSPKKKQNALNPISATLGSICDVLTTESLLYTRKTPL
jgi:hypothetical protein